MSAALAQIVLGGGAVSASLAVTQGRGQIQAGERKSGCSIGEINLAALLRAGACADLRCSWQVGKANMIVKTLEGLSVQETVGIREV